MHRAEDFIFPAKIGLVGLDAGEEVGYSPGRRQIGWKSMSVSGVSERLLPSRRAGEGIDGALATANFGEFTFHALE